ncbi:hypothetical protein ADUPG1_006465 [Aduncisulcus paluster]|uniref:Uncharacterized protein n=1 Tax=Aduncisulcus paluster TaxID=2918883 RepID=A0ABQ5KIB9_9EUKA|nr:hypothetical protein ADUPG1_006465 [Aduncisulcus paluster]
MKITKRTSTILAHYAYLFFIKLKGKLKNVKSVDKTAKPVVNTMKSVDTVHSVKQNVSSVSSVNPGGSVSRVRPESSVSGGSQPVKEKETYEAEKERIDCERSEHVWKVVAKKEVRYQEKEASLIPVKPKEVPETVIAPKVKALVEEERTRAAFEVMPSKLDEYPANVGKFRIELSDPDVVVSEPFRRIRRDWSQEIYEQLIDMERKKVIRPSTTEFHCATVIVPKTIHTIKFLSFNIEKIMIEQ